MSSIDDRIVQMQFDNDEFNKGVNDTNDALDSLKDHLQLQGATDGLQDVQDAADGLNLGDIADAVDGISSAFTALGVIGINVLSRLTQDAISMGESLISKLIDPIIEGGRNRAIAIEQAQFQFRGLGLDITKTMAAAKAAVLGTQFGLQDAATAAAQLGASNITVGHGLEGTLRAISGVAAQTGRSYGDIANIFEKVAGNGRLMGQDLLSLSASGLNAAAILAKSLHTTEANVRQMVTDGKISFSEFSTAMNTAFGANAAKANETFTGALANMKAALSRIGANIFTPLDEAERKVFNALGPIFDSINAALTPVITQFGVIANLKSDNFVKFLSTLNFSGLETVANSVGYAMRNVYTAINLVGKAIGKGFKQIFPTPTVDQISKVSLLINNLSTAFLNFTKNNSGQITRTFAGFFAILDIGWQIISRVIKVIGDLFGFINTGNGSILDFTATIGDLLVRFDKFLKSGNGLNAFFEGLENVLRLPLAGIKLLAQGIEFVVLAFEDLITMKGFDAWVQDVQDRFSGLVKIGQFFQTVWEGIKKVVHAVVVILAPVLAILGEALKTIGQKVGKSLSQLKFTDAVQAINTGLFGALVLILHKFFKNITDIGDKFANGGPFDKIFGALTDNLKAMEKNVQAKTILTIAKAVALLALSAVALSLVNPVRLAAAMGAITVGFADLLVAFTVISKIPTTKGFNTKVAVIAATLVILAVAIDLLSIAIVALAQQDPKKLAGALVALTTILGVLLIVVQQFSEINAESFVGVATSLVILGSALVIIASAVAILAHIDPGKLAAGMTAMVVALGALVGTVALLTKIDPPELILVSTAIILLATALNVMAAAVVIFAQLSWEQLLKGLGAVTLLLGELVAVVKLIGDNGPKTTVASISLLILAGALNAIAASVAIIANLSWEGIIKGLFALSGMILLLAGVLETMSEPETLLGAASLVIAASALVIIASAFQVIGNLSWDAIAKGLVAMGAAILILVGSLVILSLVGPEILIGAAALIIAAAAMFVIAGALKILGTLSWDDIGRGLTALGGAIVVLAAGGVLLLAAVPGFLGLATAIAIMGTGALNVAKAIGIFAAALVVLGTVGYGAVNLFMYAIDQFLLKLSDIATALGNAIGAFALAIATQGPAITAAITTVLLAVIQSIITVIPQVVDAIVLLVTKLVEAIVTLVPLIVNAGLTLIESFLKAIADHIGGIVDQAIALITNFINALGDPKNIKKITDSAGNFIINWMDGLTKWINKNNKTITDKAVALVTAVVDAISYAIEKSGTLIRKSAEKIGNAIFQGAMNALWAHSPSRRFIEVVMPAVFDGITSGTDKNLNQATAAGSSIGDSMIDGVSQSLLDISKAVNTNVDINPTITPVLDLTQVKKDAGLIPGIVTPAPLAIDTTANTANAISAQQQAQKDAADQANANPDDQPADITFIQNNTSPKALSPSEVYRQTKNQLSVAKKVLADA